MTDLDTTNAGGPSAANDEAAEADHMKQLEAEADASQAEADAQAKRLKEMIQNPPSGNGCPTDREMGEAAARTALASIPGVGTGRSLLRTMGGVIELAGMAANMVLTGAAAASTSGGDAGVVATSLGVSAAQSAAGLIPIPVVGGIVAEGIGRAAQAVADGQPPTDGQVLEKGMSRTCRTLVGSKG